MQRAGGVDKTLSMRKHVALLYTSIHRIRKPVLADTGLLGPLGPKIKYALCSTETGATEQATPYGRSSRRQKSWAVSGPLGWGFRCHCEFRTVKQSVICVVLGLP